MTEPIQFFIPEGRYEPSLSACAHAHHVAHLDTKSLLRVYREMTLTRKLDDTSTALQRQGQLALWIPSYGQEAAQTGSAHALRPLDTVFPS